MSSITSLTNSPACVLADFPSRLSRRARSIVSFFGMLRLAFPRPGRLVGRNLV
jgi:hypothetical protein